ncbi:MAG: tetratricopeptide repeat protein [Vulcanimicrobiota bacterium]
MRMSKNGVLTFISMLLVILTYTYGFSQTKEDAVRFFEEGDRLCKHEKYKEAIEKLKEGLKISEMLNFAEVNCQCLLIIGYAYRRLGDNGSALEYYQKSLKIAQDSGNKVIEGNGLSWIGDWYENLGNYHKALEYNQKALKIAQELRGKSTEGQILTNIGKNFTSLSDYQKAIEYAQKALKISQEIEDKRLESTNLCNIGIIYKNLGDYQKAMEYHLKSLEIAENIGDKKLECSILTNIGKNFESLSDYQKAMEYHLKSLEIAENIGDKELECSILTNIGKIFESLNDYQKAIEYAQKASKISQEIKNKSLDSTSLCSIGIIYKNFGNYQKAMEYFQNSLKIAQKIGDKSKECITLNDIGSLYKTLGDYGKAMEYFQNSLKIAQKIGDKRLECISSNNIGAIYSQLVHHQKGLEYLMNSLITGKLRDKSTESKTLDNTGNTYASLVDHQKAMEYYQKSLKIGKETGDLSSTFLALSNIGRLYAMLNQDERAIESFVESIDTLESIRGMLKVEEHKIDFIQEKIGVYELLIQLLINVGKNPDAWNYVERSKSRTFLDMLGNKKIDFQEKASQELIKKEINLDNSITILRSQLEKEVNPEKQKPIFQRLESLQKEYEEVIEKLKLSNPEYASMRSVQVASLKEIQNLIEQDSLLLEYFIGKEKSYLFIVNRGELRIAEISQNEEQLKGKISTLQERILTQSPCDVQIKSLSEILLPSEAQVAMKGKKRLIIIPHSMLHHLSFSMLVDENGDYLVKNHEILSEPSASVWKVCLDKKRNKNEALAAYALGNLKVAFQEEYKEDYSRKRKQSGDLAVRGTIVMSPEIERYGLPPLPATKEEVESISALYPGGTILMGKEMTSEKVRDTIKRKSIVHFATHGVIDPLHPLFSGLVLSDKILTTTDIFSLDMDANLVVLSACNTAGGKLYSGDDIVGLSRAFMYAGSPVVLASLWRVSDVSTAELMKNFHQELKTGESEAQALREAQLKTMEKYSHPYYWAPFVVIGESRKR